MTWVPVKVNKLTQVLGPWPLQDIPQPLTKIFFLPGTGILFLKLDMLFDCDISKIKMINDQGLGPVRTKSTDWFGLADVADEITKIILWQQTLIIFIILSSDILYVSHWWALI
jgi:hypothetical protein